MMDANASSKMMNLFNEIKESKAKILNLRKEIKALEDDLKSKETIWNDLKDQMVISYRTFEKDEIKNTSGIVFNMSADINKNIH